MAKQFTISGIVKFFGGDAAASEVKKVDAAIKGLRDSASKVQEGFGNMAANLKPIGIAGTAVAGGLGLAVSQAMAFEQAMANVNSVGEFTKKQLADMTALALKLGATTKFTATEAGDAMEILTKAGLTAAQTMSIIPSVLAAAAAEGIDMATAADIVTSIAQGTGLGLDKATQITDKLARASVSTAGSFTTLNEAFRYSSGLVQQGIMDFDTLTASLGSLANAGLQGSIAGTSLSNLFVQLVNPTEDVQAVFGGTAKMMEMFTDKVTKKFLPLPKIIDLISKAADRQTNAFQKQAFISDMVGVRGEKAFGRLVEQMRALNEEGVPVWDGILKGIQNADGAAKDMAEKRLNTLQGAWATLKSSVANFNIAFGGQFIPNLRLAADTLKGFIGDAGVAFQALGLDASERGEDHLRALGTTAGQFAAGFREGVGDAIATVKDAFMSLRDTFKGFLPEGEEGTKALGRMIAKGIVLAAVVGPLILGFLALAFAVNTVVSFFGSFITVGLGVFNMFSSLKTAVMFLWPLLKGPLIMALGAVKAAVIGLGTALMGLVANPVGAVITGIALLIAGGYLLYKNWDAVKGFLVGIWDTIKSAVASAADWIAEKWNGASNLVKLAVLAIGTVLTGGLLPIIILVARNWDSITAWMSEKWGMFTNWISEALAPVMQKLAPVFAWIAGAWTTVTTKALEAWTGFTDFLSRIDWGALLATPIKAASWPLLKLIGLIAELPGAGTALSAFGISAEGLKKEIADLTTFRPILKGPQMGPPASAATPPVAAGFTGPPVEAMAKVIPFPKQMAAPPAAPAPFSTPGVPVMTNPKRQGEYLGLRPEDFKQQSAPKLAPVDGIPSVDTSALNRATVSQAALGAQPSGGGKQNLEITVRQPPVDVNLKTSVQIDSREIAAAVAKHQITNSERNGDVIDAQTKQKLKSNGGFATAIGQ